MQDRSSKLRGNTTTMPVERDSANEAQAARPQSWLGFGMEAPMRSPMSKLPPGPRAPSAVQLIKWIFAPLPFMQTCADRYGDTFTVRLLGLPPMVFFTDPGAIRQIFTADSEQFRAGKANAVFEMFFGPNSLLLLDGARHRRERRLLMPPFHGERMRLYGEMMYEIADRSIDAWPVDRSFPVHARLQDITLEVMLRVVFGVADETRLIRLGKAVVEALDLWDVGNPLRPIKALWGFGRVRREIDALLLDEVRRRRAEEPEERTDIMSKLLAARDEDGSAMSDEEVRDEMFTMLVAGHETTATLVAWVIHRLLENPDVLEAARAEVASVVGSGPRPPAPTAEQVARLGYLDAVIKETSRLHPVVPIVVRQLETDHAVGSVALPAGCIAAPCIYLVHRRPDLWPEPNSFDPGRFVGRRSDPYTFFPFGGGVRHCLGAAFATCEAKIVLARVLSRVNLQPDPDYAVRVVRRGLALGPSAGLPVIRMAA